jgi:hypothetical protein
MEAEVSKQKKGWIVMSPAERAHRRLVTGPTKSEIYTPQEFVAVARNFYKTGLAVLADEKLPEDTFRLHLAAMTLDCTLLLTKRYTPTAEIEVVKFFQEANAVPCGLLFGIAEGKEWIAGARALVKSATVDAALQHRLERQDVGLN